MSHAAIAEMSPDELVGQIFLSQAGLDDPSPYYRQLRELAPVHRSGTGAVFLTRYDDCRELLRDNRFGKSARGQSLFPGNDPEAEALRKEQIERSIAANEPASMLFLNPPHHTRQRSLVSRAFTPRRVEQLRTSIRGIADRLVKEFAAGGGGDLLEAIAFPLPVAVIGTMVGVPEADWPMFRSLITASAAGIEPTVSADDLREAGRANLEVRAYFKQLLAERRSNPQDDLLSDLAAVEDEDGDALSDGEIIAVSILLFAAGFETTTNLIGNGMGALLRNPEQKAALWADPSMLPTAVDEMLRWDSPVQLDGRSAFEDVEIDGVLVEKGTRVLTLLGAANRDPSHFAHPDRFDVTRSEGPAMSFASGIHYCLGANLSRAEGQEVFGALIEHCASIEPAGDLERRKRFTLRGFTSVPVAVNGR